MLNGDKSENMVEDDSRWNLDLLKRVFTTVYVYLQVKLRKEGNFIHVKTLVRGAPCEALAERMGV